MRESNCDKKKYPYEPASTRDQIVYIVLAFVGIVIVGAILDLLFL